MASPRPCSAALVSVWLLLYLSCWSLASVAFCSESRLLTVRCVIPLPTPPPVYTPAARGHGVYGAGCGFESCCFSSSCNVPGTLVSTSGALFNHHPHLAAQVLHLFSCEGSGPERLGSDPWLHSFEKAQRCIKQLKRPLEKGLQVPTKFGVGHKLTLAFLTPPKASDIPDPG